MEIMVVHAGRLVKKLLLTHCEKTIEKIEEKAPFVKSQLIKIFDSGELTAREIRELGDAFEINLFKLLEPYTGLTGSHKYDFEIDDNLKESIRLMVADKDIRVDQIQAMLAAKNRKSIQNEHQQQYDNGLNKPDPHETNVIIQLLKQQLAAQAQVILRYELIIDRNSKTIDLLQEQLAHEQSKRWKAGEEEDF